MAEYKYTKDGKKVVVVGKLNNAEFIVQEIFVSNGQEVPAGENFVASGLLDEPAKSWKQNEVDKYKKEYAQLRASLDEIRKQERFESEFTENVRRRLSSYSDIKEIDTLFAFLNNEIEYVVNGSRIIPLIDSLVRKHNWGGFDTLKLLTLFGDSKCGLTWRLGYYSDGSGGSSSIYPARSLQDAKQYLEKRIKAKRMINGADIEAKDKYGLKYPSKSQLHKHRQSIIKSKKELIKNTEATLARQKKELQEM
jgi:hypothetical protein